MSELIKVRLEELANDGTVVWPWYPQAFEYARKDVFKGVNGFTVCTGTRDYFFPGEVLPLQAGKVRIRLFEGPINGR